MVYLLISQSLLQVCSGRIYQYDHVRRFSCLRSTGCREYKCTSPRQCQLQFLLHSTYHSVCTHPVHVARYAKRFLVRFGKGETICNQNHQILCVLIFPHSLELCYSVDMEFLTMINILKESKLFILASLLQG